MKSALTVEGPELNSDTVKSVSRYLGGGVPFRGSRESTGVFRNDMEHR